MFFNKRFQWASVDCVSDVRVPEGTMGIEVSQYEASAFNDLPPVNILNGASAS